jgi:hypothetical protein
MKAQVELEAPKMQSVQEDQMVQMELDLLVDYMGVEEEPVMTILQVPAVLVLKV